MSLVATYSSVCPWGCQSYTTIGEPSSACGPTSAFSNANWRKHEGTGALAMMQVTGFNLRKWMAQNSKKVPKILEALGQLVAADKLKLEYTE